MQLILKDGVEIKIEKIVSGGYIAAKIGAVFLGGTPSRDLVGKYVISVQYPDETIGLIAQEEIKEIIGDDGANIEFGNKRYPGHPDFDPLAEDSINGPRDALKDFDAKWSPKNMKGFKKRFKNDPPEFPDL